MNHRDMELRIAYLRRLATMRGHTFTERTYRKARKRAISQLLGTLEWVYALEREQRAAARYGDTDAYSSLIREARNHAATAQRHATAIVARARREKGMYQ